MQINVNNYVYVRLTPHGLNILEQQHQQLCVDVPSYNRPFVPPVPDESGYVAFQLHELMARFGDYVGAGLDLPFECEIKIL